MDLQKAFELQATFRERMRVERGINWTEEQWMLQFLTCIIDEVGEVRAELNWKHWKNRFEPNMDNVKDEVVDIWIFLIELTMSAGMDPTELEQRFLAKTQENHDRQDGKSSKPGYTLEGK